jgi:hypothetical protein
MGEFSPNLECNSGGQFFKRGFKLTPRTDVMILKIFSPKNLAKILAFFAQTTASFCKNCDHNIGF